MKKSALIVLCTLLVGCGANQVEDSTKQSETTLPSQVVTTEVEKDTVADTDEFIISEDNFVTDMDEIYTYLDDYVGRKVRYEGFVSNVSETEGDTEYAVTRFYDIDHEDHSHTILVGLNTIYEGTWPAENTWVEVVGYIEKEDVGGEPYPVLHVEEIIEKEERGQEKVFN